MPKQIITADETNSFKTNSFIEQNYGSIIYAYTRADALRDGVLIDISSSAKDAGIKYHTAVTEALWGYIEPTKKLMEMGQSVQGRLWDVLFLFVVAARTAQPGCSELLYRTDFLMDLDGKHQWQTVDIKVVCGPGDDGEPVITLMLPEED